MYDLVPFTSNVWSIFRTFKAALLQGLYVEVYIHPFTLSSHTDGRISSYDLGITDNAHLMAFSVWLKGTQWSLGRNGTESLTHS